MSQESPSKATLGAYWWECQKFINEQMHQDEDLNKIQQPIADASPQVRQIIERVLQLEKDKLYLKSPRNINDDVLTIIKEVVQ